MDRLAQDRSDAMATQAQWMYRRALAAWASDLLSHRRDLVWPSPDPINDYRDRDWTRLYTGSILDD